MKSSLKYTMNGLDKKGSVVSLLGTEKILWINMKLCYVRAYPILYPLRFLHRY